jgi:hypothetical protein
VGAVIVDRLVLVHESSAWQLVERVAAFDHPLFAKEGKETQRRATGIY